MSGSTGTLDLIPTKSTKVWVISHRVEDNFKWVSVEQDYLLGIYKDEEGSYYYCRNHFEVSPDNLYFDKKEAVKNAAKLWEL